MHFKNLCSSLIFISQSLKLDPGFHDILTFIFPSCLWLLWVPVSTICPRINFFAMSWYLNLLPWYNPVGGRMNIIIIMVFYELEVLGIGQSDFLSTWTTDFCQVPHLIIYLWWCHILPQVWKGLGFFFLSHVWVSCIRVYNLWYLMLWWWYSSEAYCHDSSIKYHRTLWSLILWCGNGKWILSPSISLEVGYKICFVQMGT
jgi:hypothetical protein